MTTLWHELITFSNSDDRQNYRYISMIQIDDATVSTEIPPRASATCRAAKAFVASEGTCMVAPLSDEVDTLEAEYETINRI